MFLGLWKLRGTPQSTEEAPMPCLVSQFSPQPSRAHTGGEAVPRCEAQGAISDLHGTKPTLDPSPHSLILRCEGGKPSLGATLIKPSLSMSYPLKWD